jgi:predicted Zn-dependent protease
MELPRTRLLQLLESATEAGASGAEVLYESNAGLAVTVQRGDVVKREPLRSEIVTLRVWGDGGQQASATGPLAMSSQLLQLALKETATLPPSPGEGPVGRLPTHTRGLGIDDRRYRQVTDDDRVDVALDDERAARSADRLVQTGPFVYRDSRTLRAVLNTREILHQEVGTRFMLKGCVSYGGGALELEGEFTSRAFAGISSLPLGARLTRDIRRYSEAAPAPEEAGARRVLLPPLVMARLIAILGEGFSHAAMASGASVWGKLLGGPAAMDPRFHLLDDGALPGAWHTRGFDDRGVPPVPLTLVKDGRVDRSFLSAVEASSQGTRPTGHQTGDGVQAGNLLVRSGTRSIAAILSEIGGDAFEVEHVLDWRGVDVATAELDLPIIGSVRTSKGNGPPIREIRLRGNLIAALGQIVDIAGDTDRWRHVDAPGILLDGLTIEARA